MWFAYLLRCRDGTLYAGVTTNLRRRLAEHRAGQGSRYVRSRGADKIVYHERCVSRAAALRRERQLKGWSRQKKLDLMERFRIVEKNKPKS